MLENAFGNKYFVAIGLRCIEVVFLFIILSISGFALSAFSEKHYIQKYTNLSQNLETTSIFLISPIYLVGAFLCSVMAVSDSRTLLSIFFWITPAILMFFVHNIFSMGSLLPTSSFLASSIIVIAAFKLTVGNIE